MTYWEHPDFQVRVAQPGGTLPYKVLDYQQCLTAHRPSRGAGVMKR